MKNNISASRQSNFELLRIVAILMVIMHHLIIKSAQTCGYTHTFDLEHDGYIGLIFNSLFVGGVNIFLLISGWFGIKKIGLQIIRLIFDCAIYCLITNSICVAFFGYPFSWGEFLYSCNFMHNWFVYAFIIFLLLTPILERALEEIDLRQTLYFVILLTLVNVIFGIGGMFKHNGYNAYNFMYLYIIGRYLRLASQNKNYRHYAKYGPIVWLLCAIPLTIGYIYWTQHKAWNEGLSQSYFGYNNPFIVLSAVALFMTFSIISIKSKLINKLAQGVFGIFLLHTTTIFIYYRTTIIGGYYERYGYIAIFISAIVLFAACCMITMVVERLKSPLFNRLKSIIKI